MVVHLPLRFHERTQKPFWLDYLLRTTPLSISITLDGRGKIPPHHLDLTAQPVNDPDFQNCVGITQAADSTLQSSTNIGDMILMFRSCTIPTPSHGVRHPRCQWQFRQRLRSRLCQIGNTSLAGPVGPYGPDNRDAGVSYGSRAQPAFHLLTDRPPVTQRVGRCRWATRSSSDSLVLLVFVLSFLCCTGSLLGGDGTAGDCHGYNTRRAKEGAEFPRGCQPAKRKPQPSFDDHWDATLHAIERV